MARRLVVILSVLFCAGSLVLWVRSLHVSDEISLLSPADTRYALATHPHGVDLDFETHFRSHPPTWNPVTSAQPTDGWKYFRHLWGGPTDRLPETDNFGRPIPYEWQPPDKSLLGVGYELSAQSWRGFNGVSVAHRSIKISLPFWLPVCLLSPPIVLYLRAVLVRRRRIRTNRCLSCGYDLRGSTGACPECGAQRDVGSLVS
jgi:hypothetical protein